MTNPSQLRAALVAKLKDISALVSLVGSADNIIEYIEEDYGGFFNAIAQLKPPPKILVVFQGTSAAGTQTRMWRHAFSIVVRTGRETDPAAIFAQIVSGVPSGETLPMISVAIDANYHPMETPAMRRTSIPVSDTSSFDFWEITTAFTSRGFE